MRERRAGPPCFCYDDILLRAALNGVLKCKEGKSNYMKKEKEEGESITTLKDFLLSAIFQS